MTEPLAPRPHQQQALTNLARGFQRHDRVTVVMAPGAGKTLVGRWAAEQQAAELTLVVVPSLTLIAQTLRAWRHTPSWSADALVICSDPTTAAGLAERDSADGEEVDSRFWSRHHAQVTTDVASVRRVLARQPQGRPLVLFSTYHSVWVAAQAARRSGLVSPGNRPQRRRRSGQQQPGGSRLALVPERPGEALTGGLTAASGHHSAAVPT